MASCILFLYCGVNGAYRDRLQVVERLEAHLALLAAERVPHPRVLVGLDRRQPLVGVHLHQLRDVLLPRRRHRFEHVEVQTVHALAHLRQDLLVVLTYERWHPRQEHVQDHPAGPDVALLVVVLLQHLRRYVVGLFKLKILFLFSQRAQTRRKVLRCRNL
jgi:hypothetical protein